MHEIMDRIIRRAPQVGVMPDDDDGSGAPVSSASSLNFAGGAPIREQGFEPPPSERLRRSPAETLPVSDGVSRTAGTILQSGDTVEITTRVTGS